MRAAELRVDGNAIAGLLNELFAREMTEAAGCCGSCNAVEPLGAMHVYGREPGVVARCVHCEGILMRVVSSPDGYRVDLSGMRWIEF